MKSKLMKRLEALGAIDEEAQLLKELDAALAAMREEARRNTKSKGSEAERHEKTS